MRTVTGGAGTIKRKREIRELLEQQDVNYEDDIFDATPFKRKKDLKVLNPFSTLVCHLVFGILNVVHTLLTVITASLKID